MKHKDPEKIKPIAHVISVSGGKDSTATLLYSLARYPRKFVMPIFCDTGNEHDAVYQYLDYLERALDIKITRLKADFSEQLARKRIFIANDQRKWRDKNGRRVRWTNKAKRRALSVLQPTGNPFLDLCMWKGRFPSRTAQFCTQELKRNLAVEFQLGLVEQGFQVVSWQGVRRDESLNRRNAKAFEFVGGGISIFRPIVDWSAAMVFDYCAAHGIKPNPLYLQGMGRVGCMPCINSSKSEIAQIAKRFPDQVSRISEWEKLVSQASKQGFSTMMHKGPAEKFAEGMTNQAKFAQAKIEQVVMWSRTTYGGHQFDLLADLDDADGCASSYGLCEAAA